MARQVKGPVLLHVVTEKGHGFEPAAEDPASFHTPAPFSREQRRHGLQDQRRAAPTPRWPGKRCSRRCGPTARAVVVITAAMCQGNMLEPIREEFPDRFFDVGICESHAVALAGGLAKAGLRPVVDIYSTFLQRSYDQIFQEVALQDLPVLLLLDRAGLVGPDGPTHHGVFDLTYLRPLPNLVVMAPGDERGPAADDRLGRAATSTRRRSAIPKAAAAARRRATWPRSSWARPNWSAAGTDGVLDRLRHAAGRLPRGRRAPGRRGPGVGRDQRPVRQAAGYAARFCGPCGSARLPSRSRRGR